MAAALPLWLRRLGWLALLWLAGVAAMAPASSSGAQRHEDLRAIGTTRGISLSPSGCLKLQARERDMAGMITKETPMAAIRVDSLRGFRSAPPAAP